MDSFICQLDKRHILKTPVKLECCNLLVCRDCIDKLTSYNGKCDCFSCKNEFSLHLLLKYESKKDKYLIEQSILTNSFQLARYSLNNFNLQLRKTQEFKENFKRVFDNYIEYLVVDIDLRVDSLYSELDKKKEKFHRLIDSTKKELKAEKENIEAIKNDVKSMNIIDAENAIDKLTCENIKFEMVKKKLESLKISAKLYDRTKSIGFLKIPRVDFNKFTNDEDNFSFIDLSRYSKSLCICCVIRNNLLAITDFKLGEILLLNSNFSVVDKLKFVHNKKIKNYYGICASDDFENIYLCDLEYHRIIIANKNMEKIKKFVVKIEKHFEEFLLARDICFSSNSVFIMDQAHKCVVRLAPDGKYIHSFFLVTNSHENSKEEVMMHSPIGITATEGAVAIIEWKERIVIFDFDGKLKAIITQINVTSAAFINGYLFAHGDDGTLACYSIDENNKVTSIFNRIYPKFKNRSESMCQFNDYLVITFGWQKMLGIIQLF